MDGFCAMILMWEPLFARELRLLRTVPRHPNLVEFYDGIGLVIEAIDGLIQTIHYIHSFGLSHGDISPGNAMIDSEGNVKLIDFGRSARTDEELSSASHPFTALDNMHSSHDPSLSDSYALGVLLLCLEHNEIWSL
ncbi:CAMK family protein kinase [Mycena vulgaris]|nr:CAMK family protein kinase [Mycena vulgaris]